MKKIILILGFLLIGINQISFAENDIYTHVENSLNGIKDGWYEATVQYSNYSTGHNATYTLNVQVKYNSVVAISFPKGGSVHSGYNDSGYFYSGGNLYFETDYNGYTVAATTTVTVSDDNGYRYFKIRID